MRVKITLKHEFIFDSRDYDFGDDDVDFVEWATEQAEDQAGTVWPSVEVEELP